VQACLMKRRSFFSAKLPSSYHPPKALKSYFHTGIKSGFPTRITKKQKFLIDKTVNDLLKVLSQPVSLPVSSKPEKRKRFSKKTKDAVLMAQNNCCRACFQYLEVPEFDHIDGDRSDNSVENCQALCPNCHAKKTRKK